ncbi:GlsB/YeaQ/YmgE family stress response membrane protein [Vibrio breoganii]|nr:GlsB/YeaQ/YmgE family stress response membrane protein [Vibrio breoganii]
MKGGGFGLVGNIVVGILGAIFGGVIFKILGLTAGGLVGSLVMSTVGAVLLLYIVGLVKKA